jgi:hypothetical protein
MTERQSIAYADPSARAYDNLNEKFRRIDRVGKWLVSTILSVNK